MSDLHHLPLAGHDMPQRPVVRARVYKRLNGDWSWAFNRPLQAHLIHGPFGTWREAYDSARRMCEQL